MRGCTRPASGRTGWPASRSARSTPPSSRARPKPSASHRLREFWETICAFSIEWPAGEGLADALPFAFDINSVRNAMAATRALFQGQPGFFKPRFPSPLWSPFSGDAATSFYDTAPLHQTLERLVDFDRLNSGDVRVSVGAVNVRTGNLTYFDTAERRLGPKHFMASGALPPGFPAVEIEGEHYWDGGVVSNTPLSRVLSGEPRDTLTFQVDLWSAKGRVPYDLMEVSSRQKDIQYSSRTRAITDHMMRMQKMRQALQRTMEELPESAKAKPEIRAIADMARHRSYNIIHLIYQIQDLRGPFEGLRVRAERDARALAERARRHPPHAGRSVAPGPAALPSSASSPMTSIAATELATVSSLKASKGIPMLKGKVAIVTGSTSGIGLGIARELAKLGADLVLNGFGDAGEIEAIRSGIERDHGVRVVYDGADMSKGDAVRGLIAATIEKFGRLDILVNNAGIQFTAPVDEFPAAKWDAILAINLSAAFHGIAAAVPQMKKQRWGRIVNIASAHGLVASTHKAAYVAAKHGLVGLTKVVGLETAGSGVTCNAVCPGWVRTPLVEKQISDIAAEKGISQKEATNELLAEKQPSLDFASPEQLGGTVAFLCSAAADQITGTAISVDGGWTAR